MTTILDAAPNYVDGLAGAPDGSVYASVRSSGIWRIKPDGSAAHFAGRPWLGSGQTPAADGVPAGEVPMNGAVLAVAPDGAVWAAGEGRVRRIDNSGISHEIAGNGWVVDPATGQPTRIGLIIAIAPLDATRIAAAAIDGEVFTVGLNGDITVVADLATNLADVATGPTGEIYALTFEQVIRVDASPTVIAGRSPAGGFDGYGDGEFADNAQLVGSKLEVQPDGDLLLLSQGRVRRIHLDQQPPTVGTVTGVRLTEPREGTVATARYEAPSDIGVAGSDLVIADLFRLRRVPDAVHRADLPLQPGEPPALDVQTDPPGLAEEQPWEASTGHEPPVRVTVTATSPHASPIRRTWIGDLDAQQLLADSPGSQATVDLRYPRDYHLSIGSYDDYGNVRVEHVRINLVVPGDACPADVPDDGFVDVSESNVHEPAIDCAVYRGLVTGTSSSTFAPGGTITRAQAATIVAQTLQAVGVGLADGPDAFVDDNGSVHERNINRLAAAGLLHGVAADRFDPAGVVTRGQLASLLVAAYERATGQPAADAADRFADDDGSVHEQRINQAASLGLVTGVTDTRYAPTDALRRDQMASVATRFAVLRLSQS